MWKGRSVLGHGTDGRRVVGSMRWSRSRGEERVRTSRSSSRQTSENRVRRESVYFCREETCAAARFFVFRPPVLERYSVSPPRGENGGDHCSAPELALAAAALLPLISDAIIVMSP